MLALKYVGEIDNRKPVVNGRGPICVPDSPGAKPEFSFSLLNLLASPPHPQWHPQDLGHSLRPAESAPSPTSKLVGRAPRSRNPIQPYKARQLGFPITDSPRHEELRGPTKFEGGIHPVNCSSRYEARDGILQKFPDNTIGVQSPPSSPWHGIIWTSISRIWLT